MSKSRQNLQGLRVLVVEDEALIAEVIGIELRRVGCEIIAAVDSGKDAVDTALRLRPDVILMDIHLKGPIDGVTAASHILAQIDVPVVYLTAHSDTATLTRATTVSAFGYVLKPFHVDSLIASLAVAMARFRMEQRLFENRLTYSTILTGISESIVVTDVDERVRFMNPAAERLTGWPLSEAEGQASDSILHFTGMEGDPREENVVGKVLSKRASVDLGGNDYLVNRAGFSIPVVGAAAPVIDGLDRMVGTTVTLLDVTNERRAQAELKATAARLRTVVDTVTDGVMLVDAEGTILLFNRACELLFGFNAAQMTGRPLQRLFVVPKTPDHRRHDNAMGAGEDPLAVILAGQVHVAKRRDGTTFPIELNVGHAQFDGRVGYVAVVSDRSERVRLESALLDAAAQERLRLGRDLHDGLGQELTGLSFLLAALARSAEEQRLPNAEDLQRAVGVMRDAMESCRRISRGLSPVGEAQGGLVAGLRELVRRASGPPGPVVQFTGEPAMSLGLTANATEHLYRIAQEALSNALKHADATEISVALHVRSRSVRLEICDDGKGLIDANPAGDGLGLRTMRYRAEMIGAELNIVRLPRAGTCVICACPVAA